MQLMGGGPAAGASGVWEWKKMEEEASAAGFPAEDVPGWDDPVALRLSSAK